MYKDNVNDLSDELFWSIENGSTKFLDKRVKVQKHKDNSTVYIPF